MPKLHRDFPDQLSVGVTLEMRQKLVAIGYAQGSGGEYAGAVRNLLADALDRYVSGLDARRRADFDSILLNVKAREVLKSDK
jgi:hypothetical protein